MSGLAEQFPALAFLAVTIVVVYVLLTSKKLARGSQSAGPVLTPVQKIHGLSSEAWDEAAISASLQSDPERTVAIVSELCRSVGLESATTAPVPHLAVEQLVVRLEKHLELEQDLR